MPQVVSAFAESRNLQAADAEKRDILELYRADIFKFGGAAKHRILSVFNGIPGALSRHDRRFSPGAVKKGSGMRNFESVFEWLKSAMTVNVAYNVTEPNAGLEMSSDHSSLKCYMGDTGLLVSMAFSENELIAGDMQQRLLTGRLEVNAGMLYENLVAQMLRSAGNRLYFYANHDRDDKSNRMEIDFLVAKSVLQRRHNISAIEVKGTGDYETRSLVDTSISRMSSTTRTSRRLAARSISRFTWQDCFQVRWRLSMRMTSGGKKVANRRDAACSQIR